MSEALLTREKDCFPFHTPIALADGGSKPIGKVVPGDLIWSVDLDHQRLVPGAVSRVHVGVADGLVSIDGLVEGTSAQTILTTEGCRRLEAIRPGDELYRFSGLSRHRVKAVRRLRGAFRVFNLELDRGGNFFAGGLWVESQDGTVLFDPPFAWRLAQLLARRPLLKADLAIG